MVCPVRGVIRPQLIKLVMIKLITQSYTGKRGGVQVVRLVAHLHLVPGVECPLVVGLLPVLPPAKHRLDLVRRRLIVPPGSGAARVQSSVPSSQSLRVGPSQPRASRATTVATGTRHFDCWQCAETRRRTFSRAPCPVSTQRPATWGLGSRAERNDAGYADAATATHRTKNNGMPDLPRIDWKHPLPLHVDSMPRCACRGGYTSEERLERTSKQSRVGGGGGDVTGEISVAVSSAVVRSRRLIELHSDPFSCGKNPVGCSARQACRGADLRATCAMPREHTVHRAASNASLLWRERDLR